MRKLRLIASSAVFLWVFALAGCTVGRESSAGNTPKPSVVVIEESTDVERSAASSSSASPADTYEDTGPRAASAATATTALDAIAANITATLLPAIQSQVATAEARVPSASLPADATKALVLTHTIAGGDTLIRIADHYGISLSSLLAVNDLPNPDHLEVGQVINLPQTPVDYTLSFHILPDSRMVRSIGARDFDIEGFIDIAGWYSAAHGSYRAKTKRGGDYHGFSLQRQRSRRACLAGIQRGRADHARLPGSFRAVAVTGGRGKRASTISTVVQ